MLNEGVEVENMIESGSFDFRQFQVSQQGVWSESQCVCVCVCVCVCRGDWTLVELLLWDTHLEELPLSRPSVKTRDSCQSAHTHTHTHTPSLSLSGVG